MGIKIFVILLLKKTLTLIKSSKKSKYIANKNIVTPRVNEIILYRIINMNAAKVEIKRRLSEVISSKSKKSAIGNEIAKNTGIKMINNNTNQISIYFFITPVIIILSANL